MPFNMLGNNIYLNLVKGITPFFLAVIILSGCSSASIAPSNQSIGSLNRIMVVADQELWDGPIGDSLRFYLAGAYPVLPQPEPLFDLQHFTQDEIDANLDRLRFRNIIYLANMEDELSPSSMEVEKIIGDENVSEIRTAPEKAGIKISKGRWAVDQYSFFLYALGEEASINNIKKNSSSIAKMVREHDEEVMTNRLYFQGQNVGLGNQINEKFGFNIDIPGDYTLALDDNDNNFMWIRKLEKASHIHHNILIHKVPYTDVEQLKPQNAKTLRDSLGKKYIESGMIDGSYMRVNDIDLPLYQQPKTVDGKFTLELKGIWEMSDDRDMMGGPFVSYVIHDAAMNELIFIDGFVFAPGKKKRDKMQGLEIIFSTITF